MHRILALIAAIVVQASPLAGSVQDAYADLNDVAKALGAPTVRSIQYTGTGGVNAAGQSVVPGLPWPEYNVKSQLVPNKPIRYVINSHHHFDHAGGLRAFVAEGVTVITQDVNRAFLAQALGAPATVRPDAQAKSGRRPTVEGVGEQRTLTDGTRTVEIYRIQGIMHHDGMLMVYLPKEKLLSQADAYTPGPPNATPPMPPSPFSVALADNIARLKLDVGDLLPLHGRLVPVAELYRAIGKTP